MFLLLVFSEAGKLKLCNLYLFNRLEWTEESLIVKGELRKLNQLLICLEKGQLKAIQH